MVNLKFISEAAIHNYLSFGIYNASENILKILRFLLSTFLPPPNSHVYIYSDKIHTHYDPSLPAAAAFLILFLSTTMIHFYRWS